MNKILRRFRCFLVLGIIALIAIAACDRTEYLKMTSLVQRTKACHMIEHRMGKTCVPQNPQRVVTISHITLGNTLLLGAKPIGSTAVNAEVTFPPYLMGKVESIEQLGTQNEPSLEKILMLKPDLILVWENIKAIYPLLSQISPTVVVPWRGPARWREQFELVTKALGREEEAKQAWNHYDQRISKLKAALGNRYQNQEISIFAASEQWGFFIQAKNSFAGFIFNSLELQRPRSHNVNTSSGYIQSNSKEDLAMIDGDILFVLVSSERDKEALMKTLQQPLARSLKAVQHGRIYFVDGISWNGGTLLAADVILDDLEKHLLNAPR